MFYPLRSREEEGWSFVGGASCGCGECIQRVSNKKAHRMTRTSAPLSLPASVDETSPTGSLRQEVGSLRVHVWHQLLANLLLCRLRLRPSVRTSVSAGTRDGNLRLSLSHLIDLSWSHDSELLLLFLIFYSVRHNITHEPQLLGLLQVRRLAPASDC